MFASLGDDTVYGSSGADSILGDTGADYLNGGSDWDTIRGGDDNDTIDGGLGLDSLWGDAGNDVFQFTSTSHSTLGNGYDLIMDFEGAGITLFGSPNDRVDLSVIDANTLVAGDQAFIFNGTTAGGAGTIWLDEVAGYTRILGNTDADATAELIIRVDDGTATASNWWVGDFIL